MAAVAAEAGVSAQTVYKAFGTKPALVKRVYDVTLVGDDEHVPLAERRGRAGGLRRAATRARCLAWYAHLGRTAASNGSRPLLTVALGRRPRRRPGLWSFVDTMNGERLVGTAMAARRLAELGALRDGPVGRARPAT